MTMVDVRFLHRMVGHPDEEHDPQIDGLVPGEHISSVRPDVTLPIDRHGNRLFDQGADDDLDMELVNTIAEHNGGPHWRERVDFLKNFRRQKYFSICRRTIDQIVQQEWFGAG